MPLDVDFVTLKIARAASVVIAVKWLVRRLKQTHTGLDTHTYAYIWYVAIVCCMYICAQHVGCWLGACAQAENALNHVTLVAT